MSLAGDLRSSIYQAALEGRLSDVCENENTDMYCSSFDGEEAFKLPKSWKWCKFSDVVTVATNLVEPKDYQQYLQIAPDYIEKGTGKLLPCNTVHQNQIRSKNHFFHTGQVIYSKIRPALRKAVIAPFDGLCSADMYPLNSTLNVNYLLLYLLSDFFTLLAVSKSAREKMPKINQKDLSEIPVPVPPIEEQQRIVKRVDEILAKINELVIIENKLIELKINFSSDMRSAILQAAMQGKLTEQLKTDTPVEDLLSTIAEEKKEYLKTHSSIKETKKLPSISDDEIPFEIPENWAWVRWGTLSNNIQYGYNAPALPQGRIRMVRISDIQNNSVTWNTVPYCNIPEKDIENYKLSENDILFARTGGTVGKSYLVTNMDVEAIYAGYLIRSNYNKRLCPQYLKYFMESPLYWMQLQNGTTRTAQPNCNGKTLSKMLIPIPPCEEQQRIVEKLDVLLPLCDGLLAE